MGMKRIALDWGDRVRRSAWRLIALPGPFRWLGRHLEPVLRTFDERYWERQWVVERSRDPGVLADVVPDQLKTAVADGWIAPGSRCIDVGTGRGQVAAWLAEQGFDVLAADISEEATRLGSLHFGHLAPRLEFRTLDVSQATEEMEGRFDFLFDRGCYHVLPVLQREVYLANLTSWARPGAKFLLFSRRGPDADVPSLFSPSFEIVHSEPILYVRSTGPYPRLGATGTAFRMIRRGRESAPTVQESVETPSAT
jgi:SAM-dependent methyltransferase